MTDYLFNESNFTRTHARRDDPPSSKRAAEKVQLKADTQCGRLLAILREGPIRNSDLTRRTMELGILNPRGRVSDLRRWGAVIEVSEDGVYRLVKDVDRR